MKWHFSALLFCLGFGTLTSCGRSSGRSHKKNPPLPPPTPQSDLQPLPEFSSILAATRAQIKEILDAIPSNCEDAPDHENCRLTQVSSKEFTFTWPSVPHQRVLIIEHGDLPFTSLGKYGNRVFFRAKPDSQGHYRESEITTTMPLGLKKIYLNVFGPLSRHISAADFPPEYGKQWALKYNNTTTWLPYDHGHLIQSYIAENAHHATFMHANYPVPSVDLLCEKNLPKLQQYYENAGDSLAKYIVEKDIRFINLSAGVDLKVMRQEFEDRCSGVALSNLEAMDLLKTVSYFYKAISSVPTAVVIQAGIFSPTPIDPTNAFIDCHTTDYTNRIRVGFYNNPTDSTPESGGSMEDIKEFLPTLYSNYKGCMDLFVNMGPKDPFEDVGPYRAKGTIDGISIHPFPLAMFSTSYAAPIATAGLLRLSEGLGEVPASSVVQNFVDQYNIAQKNHFYDFIRYILSHLSQVTSNVTN